VTKDERLETSNEGRQNRACDGLTHACRQTDRQTDKQTETDSRALDPIQESKDIPGQICMEMGLTVRKGKMMTGKRKFQKAINPMDKPNPGVIVPTMRTARACAHSDVWRMAEEVERDQNWCVSKLKAR
jgi:hypothetical protein